MITHCKERAGDEIIDNDGDFRCLVVYDRVYEIISTECIYKYIRYESVIRIKPITNFLGIEYKERCKTILLMGLSKKYVLFIFDNFILDVLLGPTIKANIYYSLNSYNQINSINDTGINEITQILNEPSYDNAELLYSKLNRFADFYMEKFNELCDCWPVDISKNAVSHYNY